MPKEVHRVYMTVLLLLLFTGSMLLLTHLKEVQAYKHGVGGGGAQQVFFAPCGRRYDIPGYTIFITDRIGAILLFVVQSTVCLVYFIQYGVLAIHVYGQQYLV